MATLLSASKIRNGLLDVLSGRALSFSLSTSGSVFLALSTTKPTYDANGEITNITEPSSAQNYERFELGGASGKTTYMALAGIAPSGSTEVYAGAGKSANYREIKFNQALEAADGGTGWGTIRAWVIYKTFNVSGVATDIALAAGLLTTEQSGSIVENPVTVNAGNVFIIKKLPSDTTGDLKLEFNVTDNTTSA